MQDIKNNRSTITWTLSTIGGGSTYYSTGPTKVVINGVEVYTCARKSWSTYEFPAAKGSETGVLVVNHNNDGSKSINVSFSTVIHDANVSTYSSSWTLDKIPRAPVISSISAFTDENTPTIKYTNYAGSSATKLEAFIYADDGKTVLVGAKSISTTANSAIYTLTEAERETLCTAAKNTNSLPVKFYLKVTIGGTVYPSEPYPINMSIVNANPTATIQYGDSNETATALTGNDQLFVLGVSDFKYTITATALKGADIYGYGVYLGSKSAAGATNTISAVDGSAFTFVVTDTRGNEYRETVNITTIPYVPVTCSQTASIELDGETGAIITCSIDGNYYDGAIGQTQNALHLYYRIAESGTALPEQWSYIGTAQEFNKEDNTYKCEHIIRDLSYDKTYVVQIAAQDAYNTVNSGSRAVTLIPVFDWSATDFNFNVPVSIKGIEQDYIVEQGEKDGWTYRKFNSGIGECWKTLTYTTTITTVWGGLYHSGYIPRQNYPFPFTTKPVEVVTCVAGSGSGWLCPADASNGGTNGADASAVYVVLRATAATANNTFYINYAVKGKWK